MIFLRHKLFIIVHYCITDKNVKINAIVFLCFSTGHLMISLLNVQHVSYKGISGI